MLLVAAVIAVPAFGATEDAAAGIPARFTSPLPNALLAADGTPITTASQWEETRRPELLELFREHVYGRNPVGRPEAMRFEIVSEADAFNNTATHFQVNIIYANAEGKEGVLPVSLYIPKQAEPLRGCLVFVVNRNRRIITNASEAPQPFWPVDEILKRGYATAAFHNSDVAPDRADDGFKSGVFGLFDPEDASGENRSADAWGTIAAWSWGMSRVIDYLETVEPLKDVPIGVVGHSRGGKASLWCGAQDERVALVISNNSGNSGSALARTTRGETITAINTTFPHWFAKNYLKYNDAEELLPVDQHLLIGLIAPRLAYIASASEDAWADPLAELSSGVEASSVYSLYGLKSGLDEKALPMLNHSLHDGAVGYHLREGKHDLTTADWIFFMDFADKHLPR